MIYRKRKNARNHLAQALTACQQNRGCLMTKLAFGAGMLHHSEADQK